MERYGKVISSFVRYQYLPHIGLTAVFVLAAGAVLSFSNLDQSGAARVMEMYAVLGGILLLVPLFLPEADVEVWQLEQSKAMSMWKLYLGRVAVAVLLLAVVVGIFVLRLYLGNSEFDEMVLGRGAYCEALFLGSMGFFVAAVTNQAVLGYMVSVLYFLANIGVAKRLWKFGLYPILRGDTTTWSWLLGAAAAFIAAGIWLRERKR